MILATVMRIRIIYRMNIPKRNAQVTMYLTEYFKGLSMKMVRSTRPNITSNSNSILLIGIKPNGIRGNRNLLIDLSFEIR